MNRICFQFVNTLQRKIEKFDDTVTWINKEEELFKKPISTFPELDEIKVIAYANTYALYDCPHLIEMMSH